MIAELRPLHLELLLGSAGWEAIAHGETTVGAVALVPGERRFVHAGLVVTAGGQPLTLTEPPLDPSVATRELARELVGRWADDRRGLVPRVLVAEGGERGRLLDIADVGRTYWIGRGEDAALALSDARLSRRHVGVIHATDGHVYVRDAESSSGTFIGEKRLPPNTLVLWPPELMIRVGRSVLALVPPIQDREVALPVSTEEADASKTAATTAASTVVASAPQTREPDMASAAIVDVAPRESAGARPRTEGPPKWALAAGLCVIALLGFVAFWFLLR